MRTKNLPFRIFTVLFISLSIIAGVVFFNLSINKEYSIYSSLMNDVFEEIEIESLSIDSLLISEYSYKVDTLIIRKAKSLVSSSNIDMSTYKDFILKNSETYKWKKMFHFSLPYKLISQDEIDTLLKAGVVPFEKNIERINRTGGVKWFSRVGFNQSGDEALFYYQTIAGPLAASRLLIGLRKIDGKWTVFLEKIVSVS